MLPLRGVDNLAVGGLRMLHLLASRQAPGTETDVGADTGAGNGPSAAAAAAACAPPMSVMVEPYMPEHAPGGAVEFSVTVVEGPGEGRG